MSTFRETVATGDVRGERFQEMAALVDTGASYTWISRIDLEALGHSPDGERDFILADGRLARYGIGWILVRLDSRTRLTPVVFGDVGSDPCLGAVTLEEFGLGVDP